VIVVISLKERRARKDLGLFGPLQILLRARWAGALLFEKKSENGATSLFLKEISLSGVLEDFGRSKPYRSRNRGLAMYSLVLNSLKMASGEVFQEFNKICRNTQESCRFVKINKICWKWDRLGPNLRLSEKEPKSHLNPWDRLLRVICDFVSSSLICARIRAFQCIT